MAKPKGSQGSSASWEWIALYLLGGVLLGTVCGLGLDYLLKTTPLFLILGIFGGFAAGLYGIYKTVF
ncbi:MAG: AtpZ/AtpI family protein [Actinobacteria bacterium]|nr:AtpZ/AtpI family protein [Actinomycetota bacterium]